MEGVEEILDDCREWVGQARADLRPFNEGKAAMFEITHSGRKDMTASWISELNRRIARLDERIARYEVLLAAKG